MGTWHIGDSSKKPSKRRASGEQLRKRKSSDILERQDQIEVEEENTDLSKTGGEENEKNL